MFDRWQEEEQYPCTVKEREEEEEEEIEECR